MAFTGPKTFKDAQGNVRRTAAWAAELAKQNTPAPRPATPTPAPRPATPAAAPRPAAPAPTPRPAQNNPRPGVGTVPAGTPAPVNDYYYVRQKQPDGRTWKVVSIRSDKLTPAQIAIAQKNGLNGRVPGTNTGTPRGDTHTDPTPGGGGGIAAPVDAGPAPAPVAPAPPPAPSWIPPMIGLGGLTADPITGRLDWSKIAKSISEVSAVDAQYGADLSQQMLQTMQGYAPLQGELASLTQINPQTGKTLYQTLIENQQRQFQQNASRGMGNAAARGIGSSGMINSTLGNYATQTEEQRREAARAYGDERIGALRQQITDYLAQQDQGYGAAYYAALSRAQNMLPSIL